MKRSPKTVQEESFEVQYTQEGERLDNCLLYTSDAADEL